MKYYLFIVGLISFVGATVSIEHSPNGTNVYAFGMFTVSAVCLIGGIIFGAEENIIEAIRETKKTKEKTEETTV